MSRQVLIINVTRMGDLVQMGTLLTRLQEEWPGAAVDLVVDRQFAAVATMLPGLREILAFDFHRLIDDSRACVQDVVALHHQVRVWAHALHERRYDRIVNLTFNRPSALLADYVGAPDIRGARTAWDGGTVVDHPWLRYFTDIHQIRRINRFNLVDVYAMGGSGPGSFAPLRIAPPAEALDWAGRMLAVGEPPAREWIAVQAGASDGMKAWRPQHFGLALARLGIRWGGGLLFIGGPSEQQTVGAVIQAYRAAGGRHVIKNTAGQTSVPQAAALLSLCRVLLTNDTGPMHLAVAVGTPVIDLSVGHVDFQETGPYGAGHWVLHPDLDCAPCGFEQVCSHQACKDRIPADTVADLLLHVMEKAPRPTVGPGFRLYRSAVDEDQLGTFQLAGGSESPVLAWYAAFWRRYWYHAFTGRPSGIAPLAGEPPDREAASTHIGAVLPLLESLCRRAEGILRMTTRPPLAIREIHSLLRDQQAERERAVHLAMETWALRPLAAAFLRQLHQDNADALDRMARHHAETYAWWLRETQAVARCVAPAGAVRRRLPIVADSCHPVAG